MPLNQQAQKSGCGFAVPATLSPPSLQLQNTKHTSAANAIQKSTATPGAATPDKEGFLNLSMPSSMVPGGEAPSGEDEIKSPEDLDKLGNATLPPLLPPPPLSQSQVEMLNRQRLKTMTNVSDRLYLTGGTRATMCGIGANVALTFSK